MFQAASCQGLMKYIKNSPNRIPQEHFLAHQRENKLAISCWGFHCFHGRSVVSAHFRLSLRFIELSFLSSLSNKPLSLFSAMCIHVYVARGAGLRSARFSWHRHCCHDDVPIFFDVGRGLLEMSKVKSIEKDVLTGRSCTETFLWFQGIPNRGAWEKYTKPSGIQPKDAVAVYWLHCTLPFSLSKCLQQRGAVPSEVYALENRPT